VKEFEILVTADRNLSCQQNLSPSRSRWSFYARLPIASPTFSRSYPNFCKLSPARSVAWRRSSRP